METATTVAPLYPQTAIRSAGPRVRSGLLVTRGMSALLIKTPDDSIDDGAWTIPYLLTTSRENAARNVNEATSRLLSAAGLDPDLVRTRHVGALFDANAVTEVCLLRVADLPIKSTRPEPRFESRIPGLAVQAEWFHLQQFPANLDPLFLRYLARTRYSPDLLIQYYGQSLFDTLGRIRYTGNR